MMDVSKKLAIEGGIPAVESKPVEQWSTITEQDIEAIADYLRTQPLSVQSGGVMAEFEQEFANYIGCKYAVSTNNGTASLMAALFACGIGTDDEVIVPTYGFHGIVIAILQLGAKAILCDIDPKTLTIDPQDVKSKITKATKVVIALHVWGNPCDMKNLVQIGNTNNIALISDAAHAHGAESNGKPLGNIEDIAFFSLGFGKLISGGELGIAVTNNIEYYERMLLYGHINRIPRALSTEKYKIYPNSIGPKLRPHALSMVLALGQLRRYEQKKLLNVKTNQTLRKYIDQIPGFSSQAVLSDSNPVYWRFAIIADRDYWDGVRPDTLVKALKAEGVPIIPNEYAPLLDENRLWQWPSYRGRVISSPNPQAHAVNPWIITLPAYTQINEAEIKAIGNVFEKISQNRAKLRSLKQ